MTERTLVTGGAGYVGRFIVEALLRAGHEVTVSGRAPPAADLFSKPVAFLPFSLEPEAIEPGKLDGFDGLVHAAFHHLPGRYRGGEGDDPATFRRLNLDGSAALFQAAKAAGVGRCVFLSSRAVYGRREPGTVLTEEMSCRPDTLYGEVKLAAEHTLAGLDAPDFVTASLRVTGVYGISAGTHKWAPLIADFLAGRPVEPRIATEVHGRDVASAVRMMLECDPALVAGRVFNVSDLLLDRHDLLALTDETAGMHHALPERSDPSTVEAMDSTRLRALGWQPGGWNLLAETVRDMVSGTA